MSLDRRICFVEMRIFGVDEVRKRWKNNSRAQFSDEIRDKWELSRSTVPDDLYVAAET